MKVAYLDCFAGASGDMIMGAFLDAGLAIEDLRAALNTLPLKGYALRVLKEERNHLFGTRFVVDTDKDGQPARTFADIRNVIQTSGLSDRVKERSILIFESLAVEEGRIHDCAPETVHFHEVGAVDSIVDIIGAVFALESLGVDYLYASPCLWGPGLWKPGMAAFPFPPLQRSRYSKAYPYTIPASKVRWSLQRAQPCSKGSPAPSVPCRP
jgi:pyridinium-3,5-bisthiocarboxylic acid mononucleotide nickel chelatase